MFKKINKNFLTKILIFFITPFIISAQLKKCDIVKCHQITGGLLTIICAFIYGKKSIVRAGWEPTYNYKLWGISFFKYLFHSLNSLISYQFSTNIIVTTDELKKYISKRYLISLKKIHVIPNCINTKKFLKINLKRKKNTAVNISRLEKQKNLFELIEICEKANLNLDVIGDGSQKEHLKKFAKNKKINIKFLGKINNEKMPKKISLYNFYLSSSKIEGSPKSILEAMSCELPIFGLKAPGIDTIISNNKNGYLFKDSKLLIKKIIESKNKKKLLNRLGKENRKLVKEKFSLDKCVKKEEKLIKSLIS